MARDIAWPADSQAKQTNVPNVLVLLRSSLQPAVLPQALLKRLPCPAGPPPTWSKLRSTGVGVPGSASLSTSLTRPEPSMVPITCHKRMHKGETKSYTRTLSASFYLHHRVSHKKERGGREGEPVCCTQTQSTSFRWHGHHPLHVPHCEAWLTHCPPTATCKIGAQQCVNHASQEGTCKGGDELQDLETGQYARSVQACQQACRENTCHQHIHMATKGAYQWVHALAVQQCW